MAEPFAHPPPRPASHTDTAAPTRHPPAPRAGRRLWGAAAPRHARGGVRGSQAHPAGGKLWLPVPRSCGALAAPCGCCTLRRGVCRACAGCAHPLHPGPAHPAAPASSAHRPHPALSPPHTPQVAHPIILHFYAWLLQGAWAGAAAGSGGGWQRLRRRPPTFPAPPGSHLPALPSLPPPTLHRPTHLHPRRLPHQRALHQPRHPVLLPPHRGAAPAEPGAHALPGGARGGGGRRVAVLWVTAVQGAVPAGPADPAVPGGRGLGGMAAWWLCWSEGRAGRQPNLGPVLYQVCVGGGGGG